MSVPFSQEPVERALFEKMLQKRRLLAAADQPLYVKRLLSDITILERAADLLLFEGVGEHMSRACTDILHPPSRVVNASAVLRPSKFLDGDYTGTYSTDGGEAGTSRDGAKAGASSPMDGGQAGTSSAWTEGRGIGYAEPQVAVRRTDDRQAPSEVRGCVANDGKAGTVPDGWWIGVVTPKNKPFHKIRAERELQQILDAIRIEEQEEEFLIQGRETGQIKIMPIEEAFLNQAKEPKQALPLRGMPSPPPKAEGQAPSEQDKWRLPYAHKMEGGQAGTLSSSWNPLDDVAVGQARLSQTRRGGRHSFNTGRKER